MNIFKDVPAGWRFYTCDNSIEGNCHLMLVRDTAGRKEWHALPEASQFAVALFASGNAPTFEDALAKAIAEAMSAHVLPLVEAGA